MRTSRNQNVNTDDESFLRVASFVLQSFKLLLMSSWQLPWYRHLALKAWRRGGADRPRSRHSCYWRDFTVCNTQ